MFFAYGGIIMTQDIQNQLGVAIIGCGYWGINYVRVFKELPQIASVTVCDQRPERLREVGERFPGVALTTDIDTVLRSDKIEAVVVSTPAAAHYEVTRRCLEAGKQVLVEKPITTKVDDAKKLIELAEANGVILMVGHTFIYNPAVQKVKTYIDQGEAGQVYCLYSRRTNLGPIRRDVNAIWDLAPHDVSIFNYLMNDMPSWVSAVGRNVLHNGYEDIGFISVGYADGTIGHIHVSWADPNKVREVVVVGSEKRIVFDDIKTMEQVRVFEKGVTVAEVEAPSYGEYRLQIRDGDILSPKVQVSEPLKNQCTHFLECVSQQRKPLTDGQAGLDVVRVMTAIDRSLEFEGVPVSIQYGIPLFSSPNGAHTTVSNSISNLEFAQAR
jgi:predicted dehydrogenase